MNFFRSLTAPWFFLFFAFVYSAQVLPRLGADSLTNDEPVEITNGYYFLTQGDVVVPHLHPPLASALNALPLLFLHLKTAAYSGDSIDRGQAFLFQWNRDQLQAITVACRSVSWFFGLLVGALLFWITRKEPAWCAAALFFWALDPTFLALAGVAKIELIPDFFILFGVWLFARGLDKPDQKIFLLTGSVTALAVAAKYDAVVLIPIFILLQIFQWSRSDKGQAQQRWGWGLFGFFAGLVLAYLPFFLFSPQRPKFLSILWEKFSENFVFAQHPFPVYFWGQAGLESHWYYFPAAFALKEPIGFLIFLVLALTGIVLGKIRIPLWQWLPALVLGLAFLPVTNLGVRYLLPLYPFLFLTAARGALWLAEEGKAQPLFRWALGSLFLWQAVSLAVNFPHELSYFNEWVLPEKKIQYLADSNLDWGQDAKRLAAVARQRNWGKVKLAYWGGVDPAVYGLDWEPFQAVDLKEPQPGWVYVINAGFYQLGPVAYPTTRPIAESWISTHEPSGKVGDGWYFYEIRGTRKTEKKGAWLPSAPFQQYRGYAYALTRPW